jgi:hypothetical protein
LQLSRGHIAEEDAHNDRRPSKQIEKEIIMQFIGHFKGEKKWPWPVGQKKGTVSRYFSFILAVEAENPDQAILKFAHEIDRIQLQEHILDDLEERIFLDHVRQIDEWPKKAVLTNFSSVDWMEHGLTVFQGSPHVDGMKIITLSPTGVEVWENTKQARQEERPLHRSFFILNPTLKRKNQEDSSATDNKQRTKRQGRPLRGFKPKERRMPWKKGELWEAPRKKLKGGERKKKAGRKLENK